jgi:hypothetical protein
MTEKRWWAPIAHFAGHTFIGSAIFAVIAVPAVGLSLLVKYLGGVGVPEFTLTVLTFLEHGILIVDAGLFVVYLCITAYKAFKEMVE